jgi:nucleotide-binding universal stress UspA family protein
VRKIGASRGAVAKAHLRGGRTTDEIVALSDKLGVGLLVVGSRAIGKVKRILMGSHSEEIVHHAHVPVLVVRRGNTWPPARLIVGEDFSEDAKRAGEIAASIGALYGSQVLLVYAHDLSEVPSGEAGSASGRHLRDMRERDEEALQSRAQELERILGSRPQIKLSDGAPATVLLEEAQRETSPALIAVGSRGLAGMTRTGLGSVSTKIVTVAQGPFLVSPHVEGG